ncbi:hypothetical protein WG907_10680 [Sphingobium sp. AN558]|uniref:hypothetical protein n=1 Tax=Sphingobium sp. AN558 TaxID=3133442 RepID=UPI0030C4897E
MIAFSRFSITSVAVVLILAGCASISPASRIRAGLIDAGLSPRMAGCMADRMVDRLSVAQLRRLQSLGSIRTADLGGMSIDGVLHKIRALDDPETFLVTSKAALACAF